MITVGIVGGVASGKSTVAKYLAKLGAVVFDVDGIAHEVLNEPEVIAAARKRWGESVVDDQGALVRRAIAQRVFGDEPQHDAELVFWESQTHPRITDRIRRELKQLADSETGSEKVIVLDAAVLLKAGWEDFCDHLLFIDAPQADRLKRALERGWTAEHFADREASQISLEEKRKKSTLVIDNRVPLERTYEQVLNFWKSLSG